MISLDKHHKKEESDIEVRRIANDLSDISSIYFIWTLYIKASNVKSNNSHDLGSKYSSKDSILLKDDNKQADQVIWILFRPRIQFLVHSLQYILHIITKIYSYMLS